MTQESEGNVLFFYTLEMKAAPAYHWLALMTELKAIIFFFSLEAFHGAWWRTDSDLQTDKLGHEKVKALIKLASN